MGGTQIAHFSRWNVITGQVAKRCYLAVWGEVLKKGDLPQTANGGPEFGGVGWWSRPPPFLPLSFSHLPTSSLLRVFLS